ncbi:MAG: type II and III secretion system protein family protein [bacterium]|jgi:pilus assembly protein CpaC
MRNVFTMLVVTALAVAQSPQAQHLKLIAGRGELVDFQGDIARISISNPEVADAVAASTREIMINAKAPGAATVAVWSKSGERAIFQVSVQTNVEPLERLLRETFPLESIRVHAAPDSISLSGDVSSPAVAERAAALAAPFAKTVVNNLQVLPPGPDKQILLRVRFAELNRLASSAFAVNLISTGALNTPGAVTTGQFQPPLPSQVEGVIGGSLQGTTSKFSISDALNIFAFRPDLNLGAFIKALQSRGLLQILAEPNLVATDGKQASFLVGGEFPIPIVQGGVNAGAVTVMFKEFGIRLTFTPVVTPNRTIKLHVQPEVSTIDQANSVTVSGFFIPALATRRMETDIELAEGQSFVIAGLIDDRVTETLAKIPGLGDIPLLGALFRSRLQNKAKTELIVMVTPELTAPVEAAAAAEAPKMPREFLAPQLEGPVTPEAARNRK